MAINQLLKNNDEPKIIQTDAGSKDGQNKCPKCGATDISVNAKTGKLRCNFCRHEFEPEKIQGMETDITKLEGEIMGSGTQDIVEDTQNVMTFKCSSCGAEVVIDTAETTQARCHWCRNFLSVNQQIPNGAIPDVVLPFNLTKAEAKEQIENFVGKRKFFAHPKFREEFKTDNIMGVYFPYMVVDSLLRLFTEANKVNVQLVTTIAKSKSWQRIKSNYKNLKTCGSGKQSPRQGGGLN